MMDYQIVTLDEPGGEMMRDTDVYVVTDNTFLPNLTVSQTVLHPGQSTKGHSHERLDEVYIFISGLGFMELGSQDVAEDTITVRPGDMIFIRGGAFYRVHNKERRITPGNAKVDTYKKDLVFTCIFQKYEREEAGKREEEDRRVEKKVNEYLDSLTAETFSPILDGSRGHLRAQFRKEVRKEMAAEEKEK